ncbi:MAG: cupin [Myxococcales bacterium]|nr:cupin [Myxococcales bacterium]
MSELRIYAEDRPEDVEVLTDGEAIAERLRGVGVRFERWTADREIGPDATQDEVLAAYAEQVERIKAEDGFKQVDVIAMKPDHPQKGELRQKFLSEHTHTEFEVRFFVEGQGLFYIHAEGMVFGALCTRGDLISVPANTPHWFDMGDAPAFKCIRFFIEPAGWVAHYTGADIAETFPRL